MLKSLYEDQAYRHYPGKSEWKAGDYLMTDHLYLVDTEISCIDDIAHTDRPFIQFKSDSTYFQKFSIGGIKNSKPRRNRPSLSIRIETCKQMALHGIGYAIRRQSP